ncbi:MAG: site-specific integrase [Dehalococcoidia bacterium]|nr:site-specific integrase [Dehalococcoidia bacterium]
MPSGSPAHKTAEAFLDAYLRELSAVGNRSAYTIRNYRTDIGSFLAWCRERKLEPLETNRGTFRSTSANSRTGDGPRFDHAPERAPSTASTSTFPGGRY